MVYLEYERFKARYRLTQDLYSEILAEKEELFGRTQPRTAPTDKDRVSGGSDANVFESYVIEMESKRIDERLTIVKSILDERHGLLRLKEQELRESKDIPDRIYCYRHLDHKRIKWIARKVNYSEAQVYRHLDAIRKNTKAINERK